MSNRVPVNSNLPNLADELTLSNRKLFEANNEIARLRSKLTRAEAMIVQKEEELAKAKTSMDAVLCELSAKKLSLDTLSSHCLRIKRDLELSPLTYIAHPSHDTSLSLDNRVFSRINNSINNNYMSEFNSSINRNNFRNTTSRGDNNYSPQILGAGSFTPAATSIATGTAISSLSAGRGGPASAAKSDIGNQFHLPSSIHRPYTTPINNNIYSTQNIIAATAHTTIRNKIINPLDTYAPLPLYLHLCFNMDLTPNPEVVRSFYFGENLQVGSESSPASFSQVERLLEILLMKESLLPSQRSKWHTFSTLEFYSDGEGLTLLPDIISHLPGLTKLVVSNINDQTASAIAGAIAVSSKLSFLELPGLSTGDEAFQHIMKIVVSRSWAAQHNPNLYSAISITKLDFSKTRLSNGNSYYLIKGPFISNLSFAGLKTLKDKFLGEIIQSCPNLVSLNLSHCTSLTNEALLYVNIAKSLKTLHLVGCNTIYDINLPRIQELHTDFLGVHLNAPMLVSLPHPLTHFSCASFDCPVLKKIFFNGTTLTQREFLLLSKSTSFEEVSFTNCRLSDLKIFLHHEHWVKKLSIHCCTGVVDDDLSVLSNYIEVLDLTNCFGLTDMTLKSIAENCGNSITILILKRCSGISDGGLSFLTNCCKLRYINLLGIRKLTNDGIGRLCDLAICIDQIIHETFVSSNIKVDRVDDEEFQRTKDEEDESKLLMKRQERALKYVSTKLPSLSPRPPSIQASSTSGGRDSSNFDHDDGRLQWQSPLRFSRPHSVDNVSSSKYKQAELQEQSSSEKRLQEHEQNNQIEYEKQQQIEQEKQKSSKLDHENTSDLVSVEKKTIQQLFDDGGIVNNSVNPPKLNINAEESLNQLKSPDIDETQKSSLSEDAKN